MKQICELILNQLLTIVLLNDINLILCMSIKKKKKNH